MPQANLIYSPKVAFAQAMQTDHCSQQSQLVALGLLQLVKMSWLAIMRRLQHLLRLVTHVGQKIVRSGSTLQVVVGRLAESFPTGKFMLSCPDDRTLAQDQNSAGRDLAARAREGSDLPNRNSIRAMLPKGSLDYQQNRVRNLAGGRWTALVCLLVQDVFCTALAHGCTIIAVTLLLVKKPVANQRTAVPLDWLKFKVLLT